MANQTAVVYFTKGGAAATYANVIADVLAAAGHIVDVIDLKEVKKPNIAAYDNVVLGTGVRIGMVYRRAKRFLKQPELRDKRLAIFLASGIAIEEPDRSRDKFIDPIVNKYRLRPVMVDAFPGIVPGAADTDPDTVDPAHARQWAESLVAALAGHGPTGTEG